MDILGTAHVNFRINKVDKKMQETYPQGIESLLLEIPKNNEEWKSFWKEYNINNGEGNFFEELGDRWSGRGTKIIYGDIIRPIPKQLDNIMKKCQMNLTKFDRGLLLGDIVFYAIRHFGSWYLEGCWDIIIGKRDKNFEEIIRKENPQVVLLGDLHTGYLRKKFPEANYKFV